ncbi:MAG: 3-phosphoshikimate 1-carboxyvinyltransferase [Clostridium sp.]|nr:3-phosphoshikimate 1-carboxyvinyltransferase [Clostridium sp.]
MEDVYQVRKLEGIREIKVQVPGSKSITNRALLLAALSNKRCRLRGILFSDDSRAFLDSLKQLGFEVEADEEAKEAVIWGMGGRIPNPHAAVNVRSAGTAARFLTVMLALAGGEYEMQASLQMCRRPMQPLLDLLIEAGVHIEYRGEEGHFPFFMKSLSGKAGSKGSGSFSLKEVSIDTGISSQFASALLMSGVLLEDGLKVNMQGQRTESPYIQMTLTMMRQFGIEVVQEGNSCQIPHKETFGREEYQVEPDISGACYFYAMAPLLKTDVIVKDVHEDSLQGDIQFLNVLRDMGCLLRDGEEGICVSGKHLAGYPGMDISMKDFSDQTMTMTALGPFAESPTLIRNIGHIRFQESDRIGAILTELGRMGISCEEAPEADGIRIFPGKVKACQVETYEDHRMAMAFTLIGLKTGGIGIKNPQCCRKTFENYFDLIEGLYLEK